MRPRAGSGRDADEIGGVGTWRRQRSATGRAGRPSPPELGPSEPGRSGAMIRYRSTVPTITSTTTRRTHRVRGAARRVGRCRLSSSAVETPATSSRLGVDGMPSTSRAAVGRPPLRWAGRPRVHGWRRSRERFDHVGSTCRRTVAARRRRSSARWRRQGGRPAPNRQLGGVHACVVAAGGCQRDRVAVSVCIGRLTPLGWACSTCGRWRRRASRCWARWRSTAATVALGPRDRVVLTALATQPGTRRQRRASWPMRCGASGRRCRGTRSSPGA